MRTGVVLSGQSVTEDVTATPPALADTYNADTGVVGVTRGNGPARWLAPVL